ncbi:MAG: hypothetical protein KKF48_03945 [Nanoarchaeota archaeon]|nr:hypothetical protein [Nanoarchaeota archaeon]MBU1028170.1 hypothetical protein [Nanoarchaeota archaeon]
MEKDIGKINKNDMADIVIRVDDFGGRKGLTIREFITSDRYTGFTKSGVKIPAKDFVKFKEMINSITDEDMAEESLAEEKPSPPEQEILNEKSEPAKTENSKNLPDY